MPDCRIFNSHPSWEWPIICNYSHEHVTPTVRVYKPTVLLLASFTPQTTDKFADVDSEEDCNEGRLDHDAHGTPSN